MADNDGWGGALVVIALGAGAVWWLTGPHGHKAADTTPPPPLYPTEAPTPMPRPSGFVPIAFPKTGAIWTLDEGTVTGPRKAREAWITVDHSKDKTATERTTKILYLVDCGSGAVKELASVAYDAEGHSLIDLSVETSVDKADTHYYPPGTNGASIQRNICDPVFDAPVNGVQAGNSQ